MVTAVATTITVNSDLSNLLSESWNVIYAWGRYLGRLSVHLICDYPEPTFAALGVLALLLVVRNRSRKA